LLNSRWRQPPCWILTTRRFSTPCMSLYSKSQHSYQFDEIWSNNEGTASVFLISRWRQTPCLILATRRFLVANMCSYSKSQHSYQIWWKLVKQWRKSISFVRFKMAAAAMLDSDNQVFFDAMDEFSFKVAKICQNWLKMWERHQFRLRELNVPVIFTDKGLLQIRATNIFTDKVLLQIRAWQPVHR